MVTDKVVAREDWEANEGLNPYCNGRWSLTVDLEAERSISLVLILIVMEDGH